MRDYKKNVLSLDDVEDVFKYIYDNKMIDLKTSHKATQLEYGNNTFVIEVMEFNNHIALAKIGKQNPSDMVALRDKTSLESEKVSMTSNQLLELYTFFLIDFKTGIVSYISISGNPSISAIKNFFQKNYDRHKIVAHLAAITTDNILQTLLNKKIISKIRLTVAVPSSDFLSEQLGLDINDFYELDNVKTRTTTYNIVANRNKNIFHTPNKASDFIQSIKDKFGKNLKGLQVNAKDLDESSQSYDLLQYRYTRKVTLEDDMLQKLNETKIIKILKDTYNSNKEELLLYVNQDHEVKND